MVEGSRISVVLCILEAHVFHRQVRQVLLHVAWGLCADPGFEPGVPPSGVGEYAFRGQSGVDGEPVEEVEWPRCVARDEFHRLGGGDVEEVGYVVWCDVVSV